MKEGANPEMDELKKLVSGRLRRQTVEPHPDPDVLTAFAENALLEADRTRLLQHLGACNNCREILFLAAPDSAEAQRVLSFQPRRSSAFIFRWGALAASVVIVAVAVVARYPRHRDIYKMQAAASPVVQNYSKVAEEKVPAEEKAMRDRLALAPQPVAKQRPEAKHMTAKPQASMEFDDSDQVRVAAGPKSQNERKAQQSLPLVGRNVGGPLSATGNAGQANQTWQYSAGQKASARADSAYAAMPTEKQTIHGSATGAIGGTVFDASGAVIGNAKVTTVGPVGSETATSDQQGNFVFNSLAPGSYSVKAEAPGFESSEITNVAVLDNKAATVGVRLEPGRATETVEVNAEAMTVNGAAPAPTPEAVNGFATTESEIALQKAVASNSPQRASAVTPRWTISAKGALERSLDFGKTWHKVSVADGVVWRALSVVGPHIWIGGNRGFLYHSADSGQTWTKIVPSAADAKLDLDVSHIEFSDFASGTVSTTNGEVWSTSDSGQTWRRK